MASSTDYQQEYQQAQMAYVQENYEEAARIVDRLVDENPNDPSARLLRGHIYCYGLQQYDIAQEQYQAVLGLTSDPEFTGYANQGLSEIESRAGSLGIPPSGNSGGGAASADLADIDFDAFDQSDFASYPAEGSWQEATNLEIPAHNSGLDDSVDLDLGPEVDLDLGAIATPGSTYEAFTNPFEQPDSAFESGNDDLDFADPFATAPTDNSLGAINFNDGGNSVQDFDFTDEVDAVENFNFDGLNSLAPNTNGPDAVTDAFPSDLDDFEDAFAPSPVDDSSQPYQSRESQPVFDTPTPSSTRSPSAFASGEDETLFMGSGPLYDELDSADVSFPAAGNNGFDDISTLDNYGSDADFPAYGSSIQDSQPLSGGSSSVDFLEEFDEFDDLGNLSDFDLSENSAGFTSPAVGSEFGIPSSSFTADNASLDFSNDRSIIRDEEVFSLSGTSEQVPSFTQMDSQALEMTPTVEQGFLAPLENAPITSKQGMIAIAAGMVSAVLVAGVGFAVSNSVAQRGDRNGAEIVNQLRNTGLMMAGAAFFGAAGTTFVLGQIAAKKIRQSTDNLQDQINAVCQGNLNARATVYAEDEFGQLSNSFNQMARVILTTTSEAQRKAEEQEQAKEDLQRQVIRLLDDVEGAARGDLTVQAEVTADVLGAVADSFNLTIQNLREIVQQVKVAARQVTKGSTDNEMFARGLSSDALRQAEELAVTLNSVQVMTESIQRVAESAREAEEVARSASETALRGGEAVERTVAGILQIRETVAETTRKVKRLAESSQEISKIVALISQIASRTNLLALNASIEAARAGEAGRGFAIVADEVRQLADRAAKNSKEIEQIVLQIQSETGSVMTAMEEGTQQVIEGTRLAEQAKRSLEDIIQVSNRIDVLVRSITADTVEQTETSRAVAQVMQSVELTAQETSQEAQRVSASLQNLVGVARDLLTSVERFRVETVEH